jgi:transposase
MNIPKTKSMSKSQLASAYGVHICTLKTWLKPIKGLDLHPAQRILTPKQVELIIAHLGEP